MGTPPGGAPCVCRERSRSPGAPGWQVRSRAKTRTWAGLAPVTVLLGWVGTPSMPRRPRSGIPIPNSPAPRGSGSVQPILSGVLHTCWIPEQVFFVLSTPDRIRFIISSTGSCQALCASLDTAMVLRVIPPHDREGPAASSHARHERELLSRENEKDQK